MAPSIIGNDAIQGEVFLPGQIFDGAIKPSDDDAAELSMKAPMSVSKPADLG